MDPVMLGNITRKLDEVLDAKNKAIKDLQYELARVTKVPSTLYVPCSLDGASVDRRSPSQIRVITLRGVVFEAHRLLYHSTLGLRVIKRRARIQHLVEVLDAKNKAIKDLQYELARVTKVPHPVLNPQGQSCPILKQKAS